MNGKDDRQAAGLQEGGASPVAPSFREMTTDALRHWEPRRLVYNALLALIVLWHFAAAWPVSRYSLTLDAALSLIALGVMANVAYSSVYVADVFIQMSSFRAARGRWRWAFLVVGFALASILTHFFSSGIFVGKRG